MCITPTPIRFYSASVWSFSAYDTGLVSRMNLSLAGEYPRLQKGPLLPQDEQKQGQQHGGPDPGSSLHQRRYKVGQGGDKDQEHGHEGQDDVDEFPQERSSVGVLHSLQLNHLLLLLLKLQFGDAGQTRLHGLLRARRTHTRRNHEVTFKLHHRFCSRSSHLKFYSLTHFMDLNDFYYICFCKMTFQKPK